MWKTIRTLPANLTDSGNKVPQGSVSHSLVNNIAGSSLGPLNGSPLENAGLGSCKASREISSSCSSHTPWSSRFQKLGTSLECLLVGGSSRHCPMVARYRNALGLGDKSPRVGSASKSMGLSSKDCFGRKTSNTRGRLLFESVIVDIASAESCFLQMGTPG
jgi:hypothetical protein